MSDVREDNSQRSLLVVPPKQRKSKSVAAPFEAYNSEQEVFLARSSRLSDLREGGIGGGTFPLSLPALARC